MKFFIISACIVLFSVNAWSARNCRAILQDHENSACVKKDEALEAMSDKDWNTYVCSDKSFFAGFSRFHRDSISGDLYSYSPTTFDRCDWFVKANSGGH